MRYHGHTAKIEVTEESLKAFMDDELRRSVAKRFKEIGFTYVTLDLEGYRDRGHERGFDARAEKYGRRVRKKHKGILWGKRRGTPM